MELGEDIFIPKPLEVSATGSSFEINFKTKIFYDESVEKTSKLAGMLYSKIKDVSGMALEMIAGSKNSNNNSIILMIDGNDEIANEEGYTISIEEDRILLVAVAAHGLFNAIQTFNQLLKGGSEMDNDRGVLLLPTGKIVDYPVYSHRGTMLDVSRHFFKKEVVLAFIDYLAEFKMNVLHLHLYDDQGWRIEI